MRLFPSKIDFKKTTKFSIDVDKKFNNFCRDVSIQKISKYNKETKFLLTILIPVYNEEKSIREIINKIPEHNWIEIIIIDDGSSDKSVEEINNCTKSIKLIKHKRNRGYGNALLSGINHANGDIIITLDSDGQHNPNEIYNLIKPILKDEAEIVIGSRYVGKCNYNIPVYVRIGEKIIEIFLKFLIKQKIINNQSGYRAFKREATEIFENIKFKDFAFATEVLLKAGLKKYRIKEVPIILEPRRYGSSKMSLIKTGFSLLSSIAFYTLIKLKFLVNRNV